MIFNNWAAINQVYILKHRNFQKNSKIKSTITSFYFNLIIMIQIINKFIHRLFLSIWVYLYLLLIIMNFVLLEIHHMDLVIFIYLEHIHHHWTCFLTAFSWFATTWILSTVLKCSHCFTHLFNRLFTHLKKLFSKYIITPQINSTKSY